MRRLTKKHKHEFEVNHFGRNRCRVCLKTPDEVTIDSQAAEIRDLRKRLKVAKEYIDCDNCGWCGTMYSSPRQRCDECAPLKAAIYSRKPFKPEGET